MTSEGILLKQELSLEGFCPYREASKGFPHKSFRKMTCGIYIPLCSLSHFGSLSWRAPELALRQAVSSQPNKLLILSSL